MNQFKWILTTLTIFYLSAYPCFAQEEKFKDLIDQLNGRSCKYESSPHGVFKGMLSPECKKRGLFSSFVRRNDKDYCIVDAVVCLAVLKDASAVPELIQSLRKYKDVDTGDGIIPIRESIIMSLGFIGDKRAVAPLTELLHSKETTALSKGASGVEPKEIDYDEVIHDALDLINASQAGSK